SWPGNIRELQNLLERTIVLEKSEVISEVSLPKLRSYNQWDVQEVTDDDEIPLHQWIKEQEKQYLLRKLSLFGGRVDLTARSCCVGVRTLSRKLHFYGIDKTRFSKVRFIFFYLSMGQSFSCLTETASFGLSIADLLL